MHMFFTAKVKTKEHCLPLSMLDLFLYDIEATLYKKKKAFKRGYSVPKTTNQDWLTKQCLKDVTQPEPSGC